ncbi:hypothetical protein ACTFIZ_003521 [Dictyostelium cf. discoideum]
MKIKKRNIQFVLILLLILNNCFINSQVENSKKEKVNLSGLIQSYGSELFNFLNNWNKVEENNNNNKNNNNNNNKNKNSKVINDDRIVNKISNFGNQILSYFNLGGGEKQNQKQKENQNLFSKFSNEIQSLFNFEKNKDKKEEEKEEGILPNIIKNIQDYVKWGKNENNDSNGNDKYPFFQSQSSSFSHSPYDFFGININNIIPSPLLNEISDSSLNYLKQQFGLDNQIIQLLIQFRNTIIFTITFIIFLFTSLIIYYLASIGNSIIISIIIAILTVFLWVIITLFFIIVIGYKKNVENGVEL